MEWQGLWPFSIKVLKPEANWFDLQTESPDIELHSLLCITRSKPFTGGMQSVPPSLLVASAKDLTFYTYSAIPTHTKDNCPALCSIDISS